MQLGLILSAGIDIFLYTVYPSLAALPKVYVSGIVYFKNYDVHFYVRELSDDLYSVTPGREGDVNESILRCVEEGDTFIDVGANAGYYSVLAGKIVRDKGQVISIEPVPSTAKVLKLNVKLNGLRNVKVIPKAAWSNRSLINIYLPKSYYGWASPVIVNQLYGGEPFAVEAIPLDTVCNRMSSIKLMKIDVEGSEYQILQGAQETLKKTKCVILELSKDSNEILRLLKEASFKIRKLKFSTYICAEKFSVLRNDLR